MTNRVYVLLGFVLLAFCYWLVAVQNPIGVGFWQDDATYIASAQSLAMGEGYRLSNLPGEPLQTHYPILYPALLALAMQIEPAYPGNLSLLLIPGALAASGLVVFSILYWRRAFDPPVLLLGMVGVLAAASPVLLSFLRFTMSDLVFGFFAVAALYCLDIALPTTRRRGAWLVLGALLVGLTMLTRSIGLSLAAGAIVMPLWHRRFADAGVILVIVCLVTGPWWAWQSWAASQNAQMAISALDKPELSYGLWAPVSFGQVAEVVRQNSLRLVQALSYYQLAVPIQSAQKALESLGWRAGLLHVAYYAVFFFTAMGFLFSLRKGLRTLHGYALVYLALVLAWPFEPHRFLIPWTPFLLYFLVSGLANTVRAVPGCGSDRWAVAAALPLVLSVGFFFAMEDVRILSSRPESAYLREVRGEYDFAEVDELYEWIRLNTEPDAVISAPWSAGIFLNTSRQGHFPWPALDPYKRYYGADRTPRDFYSSRAPSESEGIYTEMRHRLIGVYTRAGVDYYVEQPHWLESQVLARIIEIAPGLFELVFSSSKGTYRVYRVRVP